MEKTWGRSIQKKVNLGYFHWDETVLGNSSTSSTVAILPLWQVQSFFFWVSHEQVKLIKSPRKFCSELFARNVFVFQRKSKSWCLSWSWENFFLPKSVWTDSSRNCKQMQKAFKILSLQQCWHFCGWRRFWFVQHVCSSSVSGLFFVSSVLRAEVYRFHRPNGSFFFSGVFYFLGKLSSFEKTYVAVWHGIQFFPFFSRRKML